MMGAQQQCMYIYASSLESCVCVLFLPLFSFPRGSSRKCMLWGFLPFLLSCVSPVPEAIDYLLDLNVFFVCVSLLSRPQDPSNPFRVAILSNLLLQLP